MTDAKDPKLALFELYLATAEKVSDRRAQANTWMLSVNSAIVALYGYLRADKMALGAAQKAVWLWAIPAAGAIVCLAWAALLTSYRDLNRAKLAVLMQIEADLPVALFTRERETYRREASVAVEHRAPDPGLLRPALRRHACRGSRNQGQLIVIRSAPVVRAPGRTDAFVACFRNGRSCAGFWTPASRGAPLAPAAGVEKAPRHEVAGSLGPGGQPALWGFAFRVDYDGGREAGARRPGWVWRGGLEA